MATDKQVAAEREKVEKLRDELAQELLEERAPATENDVTLSQLAREREALEKEIADRKDRKARTHELASDPLAYGAMLLERRNAKATALTESVVLEATGDKKAAKAAAAEASANDDKTGGN